MGDWPKLQNTRVQQDDAVPASYPTGWFTTITGGAANTKGAYVTLVASTPFDVSGIFMAVSILTGGAARLMDIAIGSVGGEQVIVPNLPFQNTRTASAMDTTMYLPLKIRKGVRISVRCQGTGGSDVLEVKFNLCVDALAGFQGATRWAAYGVDLTVSSGLTVVADAGSVNGPFTELVASAPFTSRFAYLCMLNGGADDYTFDFAIGTQLVFANIRNSMQQQNPLAFVPWYIPKGAQVQMRVRSVNGIDVRGMVVVGG